MVFKVGVATFHWVAKKKFFGGKKEFAYVL